MPLWQMFNFLSNKCVLIFNMMHSNLFTNKYLSKFSLIMIFLCLHAQTSLSITMQWVDLCWSDAQRGTFLLLRTSGTSGACCLLSIGNRQATHERIAALHIISILPPAQLFLQKHLSVYFDHQQIN